MLDKIIRFALTEFPQIRLAIFFGSMAKGNGNRESDIDIAVAASNVILIQDKKEIIEKLAVTTMRPIDLIDLNRTSVILLRKVLKTGKVLLKKDAVLYARLIRRSWNWEADMAANWHFIMDSRRRRFINAK